MKHPNMILPIHGDGLLVNDLGRRDHHNRMRTEPNIKIKQNTKQQSYLHIKEDNPHFSLG